ncbi:MAG: hypothetical protein U0075_25810 [Thermomicrobiales bacterium]
MRTRLLLAGLGILLIAAAVLIFQFSRIDPPPAPTSALGDEHDHAGEILPPAPIGRTLFGGNSGELRGSPEARTGIRPAVPAGTPTGNLSLEVFAPARFAATPESTISSPVASGP